MQINCSFSISKTSSNENWYVTIYHFITAQALIKKYKKKNVRSWQSKSASFFRRRISAVNIFEGISILKFVFWWKGKFGALYKQIICKVIFKSQYTFPGCFENCFESVVLPENFSGSTTDCENNFSHSLHRSKKSVLT